MCFNFCKASMKPRKLLLCFTIAINVIQSSIQYTQKKQEGFAQTFSLADDGDKFSRMTLSLTEMLETCNSADIGGFGLIRDHVCHIRLSQTFLGTFPLIQLRYLVLGVNEAFVPLSETPGLYRAKLDAFILIASTARNLGYMLKRLSSTKWQNSEGLFILIDSSTVKSGCRNAEAYLKYIWKSSILDAVFVCLEHSDDIFIYTYNPFTNRAPQPWQEIVENKTRRTRWTLFKRRFIRDEITCADLMFDKALQLDGYKYRAIAVQLPPAFAVNKNPESGERFSGIDSKIHWTFVEHVNATPAFTVLAGLKIVEARKLFKNISQGDCDVLINNVYNFNKHQATLTYPHLHTGLAILTKFTGYQTGYAKIVHFMNPRLIGVLAIVYIVTIFVLGILNRYGIITAFLEVTRLTTNSSMTRRIERTHLRIYLFPIFLLFLISNATFQCKLAAILTRPIGNRNIDTLEDLQATDLLTYAALEYKDVINDTLLSNLRIIDDWNCSRFVINEENSACLADRYELMKIVVDSREHNLYLSSKDILSLTSAYAVKPFWPLRQKFNEILCRLFTSGILELWKREDAQIFIQSSQMYRITLNDRSFRILTIHDLKFAFISLFIGLGCSICVFFIECMISCYVKGSARKNKSRSRILSNVQQM